MVRDVRGTKDLELPQGDGKAQIAATRGVKHWFSTREAGMTVESTVMVQLTCGQSPQEIRDAANTAGNLAEELASDGMESMDAILDREFRDAHH